MAAANSGKTYSFKVVLLGEGCVGKTSLVLRYCENKFNDKHITTLQVRGAEEPGSCLSSRVAGGGESCVSWPGPTGGAELLRNIGGVVAVTGSDDGGESQVFFREIYGHKQPEIHLIHLTSLTVFTTGALISKGGQGQKRVAVAPQEPPTEHFKAFSGVDRKHEEAWGKSGEEMKRHGWNKWRWPARSIKTKACTGEGLGGGGQVWGSLLDLKLKCLSPAFFLVTSRWSLLVVM